VAGQLAFTPLHSTVARLLHFGDVFAAEALLIGGHFFKRLVFEYWARRPKVTHLDLALIVNEDVGRLDVAVHDACFVDEL